jgi:hypothetical protein
VLAMGGLLLLAKVVWDLKVEVSRLARGPVPAPPASAAPVLPAASSSGPDAFVPEAIPPEVRAAIAAAVFATRGRPVRIVSVAPADALLWSREGRRQVFQSHSPR